MKCDVKINSPPLDWLLDQMKSIIECIENYYLEEEE